MTRAEFLRLTAAAVVAGLAPSPRAQIREDPPMQQRQIPTSGEALPVVGCGTWRGFDVAAGQREPLRDVVRALLAGGGSLLDSSPMYGAAEDAVGDVVASLGVRPQSFLATKVWTRSREAGVRQIERSFALLRSDVIDLMQIHNLVDWRTHLATLRNLKAEGRIRYLGITHYTAGAHDDLEAVIRSEPVDFVQLNYAVDDRSAENRLLPLAAERGVAVIVNLPFGGGGLLGRLSRRPLPGWAGELECTSWAQLLLKFALSHPAVTCVIPGTADSAHMRDNAAAGRPPFPDAGQRQRLIDAI